MTQTTIVGGLGLSVFAFSTFTPTQRFGMLMLTILLAGVLGELVFLPALLASPLGKFFMPYPDNGPDQSKDKVQVEDHGPNAVERPNTGNDVELADNSVDLKPNTADPDSIERTSQGHPVRMHNHLNRKAGKIVRVDQPYEGD